MPSELLLFVLFATGATVSAIGVVILLDPVKSAMGLIACFFCLACLYILLEAELIGVLQVLVYAGAVMVLFVFVLMLVDERAATLIGPAVGQKAVVPLKVFAAMAVAGALIAAVVDGGPWGPGVEAGSQARSPNPAFVGSGPGAFWVRPDGSDFGTAVGLGRRLFGSYGLHFELVSVLLLAAVVGAVAVSRRAKRRGGA